MVIKASKFKAKPKIFLNIILIIFEITVTNDKTKIYEKALSIMDDFTSSIF